jgi:hypothetical protein
MRMKMIMMFMGKDYVSELQPPMGLLAVKQEELVKEMMNFALQSISFIL